jgi:glycosyltransferase involved in cell wall biosynthesis
LRVWAFLFRKVFYICLQKPAMKKIMFWGDSPTVGTGFGNVLKFIIKHLPRDKYQISVLGTYDQGKPHDLDCTIYPVLGNSELLYKDEVYKHIKKENPDIIFLLNDIWVINHALEFFKEYKVFKKSKVVAYMPVDATDHYPEWYSNAKYLKKLVVYNKFGQDVVKAARPEIQTEIIEHGVDNEVFFKLPYLRSDIREKLFQDAPELDNAFVFLNAGRNQPRKQVDISMRAFAQFAKGKKDVYLYMHCGYVDAHIDVMRLAKILGIVDKLLMTTATPGMPNVPIEHLNYIYNFCDVGLNSGLGEGFGLPNVEHAAIGKPQIVADHSALADLHGDCGLLVPAKVNISLPELTTTGKMILPEDMAGYMELLYSNRDVYKNLSMKSSEKFNSLKYSWAEITKQWITLFEKL